MEDLKEYDELFFPFLEAGFVAINQADEDAAIKLFNGCRLLNGENSLIEIGIGYLHLHKLELKKSIECFENVLTKEPDNDMARTFLGIAQALTPDQVTKGEKVLMDAAKNAKDDEVKKVADTTLDFVDQFVKQGGSSAG